MILCSSEIEGWVVRYTHNGVPTKMICLDKVKADAYSVQHHGIVTPMYCPLEQQPIKTELWGGETTLADLDGKV